MQMVSSRLGTAGQILRRDKGKGDPGQGGAEGLENLALFGHAGEGGRVSAVRGDPPAHR